MIYTFIQTYHKLLRIENDLNIKNSYHLNV